MTENYHYLFYKSQKSISQINFFLIHVPHFLIIPTIWENLNENVSYNILNFQPQKFKDKWIFLKIS